MAMTIDINLCNRQLDGRGKDAALEQHKTLSTFPSPRRLSLKMIPPKVCGGEKETKEQSNGVSENLVAKMRPE